MGMSYVSKYMDFKTHVIYIYIYEFYVHLVDAIVLCVINANLEHDL